MPFSSEQRKRGRQQRRTIARIYVYAREQTVHPTSTPGACNFITEKNFHLSTEQRQDGRFESTLPTESAWGLIRRHTFLFKILYIPALTLSRIALF